MFIAAAVAGLISITAGANDTARVLDVREQQELRAMFDRAPGVISDDANGITVGAFAVDVLVARIGADGKRITACVDNEEAARRFLTAPVGKLSTGEAKQK